MTDFGMGPAWARNTRCCGKPVGCTNMSDQCRMLGHPWKKWHREEFGPLLPQDAKQQPDDGQEDAQ